MDDDADFRAWKHAHARAHHPVALDLIERLELKPGADVLELAERLDVALHNLAVAANTPSARALWAKVERLSKAIRELEAAVNDLSPVHEMIERWRLEDRGEGYRRHLAIRELVRAVRLLSCSQSSPRARPRVCGMHRSRWRRRNAWRATGLSRRRLSKLSCAGCLPHDRGFVSGLPPSRGEHRPAAGS